MALGETWRIGSGILFRPESMQDCNLSRHLRNGHQRSSSPDVCLHGSQRLVKSSELIALVSGACVIFLGLDALRMTNKQAQWLKHSTYWCPRTESNRYLMITNQLHDLHATGATYIGAGL